MSTTPAAAASPGLTAVREVVLRGTCAPEALHVEAGTRPAPEPGQALVRVDATGVSFAERSMRRGVYPGQPPFPFVPGYDLVGTVLAVGDERDRGLVGTRVAAATKTGGWATHAVLAVGDLVPVPDAVDAASAETVVVNGITAWQMLHRSARVQRGDTVLVLGANGGVGAVLVQLARHAGLRVIAAAAPRYHDALRAPGVELVDGRDPALAATVRALAPGGVAAVFDHLGEESARRSWTLLARGGSLVVYGTAADLDSGRSLLTVFVRMLARIVTWNVLPNGRRASFYDFWGGHRTRPAAYRRHQHEALSAVLDLVASGVVRPAIAARFPLDRVAEAMTLAESGTVHGKVVLVPSAS